MTPGSGVQITGWDQYHHKVKMYQIFKIGIPIYYTLKLCITKHKHTATNKSVNFAVFK